MRDFVQPGSGLSLPINRRGFLRAGTILTSAGRLSPRNTPLFAAEAFERIKGQDLSSKIDWPQAEGSRPSRWPACNIPE